MDELNQVFDLAARLDRIGITVTRIGLVVVLVWHEEIHREVALAAN
jgi:hypothetical protein